MRFKLSAWFLHCFKVEWNLLWNLLMWFSSWVGEVMKEEQCNVGWISMLAFGFLAPCVIIQEMYITPFKELDLTIINVKMTDGKTVQLQFVEKFSCQDLFSPENLQRTWFNILCLLNRPISTHIIRRQRYLSPTNSYFFQKSSKNLIQRNRPISTHNHNSKTKTFVTNWRQNCFTSSFLV